MSDNQEQLYNELIINGLFVKFGRFKNEFYRPINDDSLKFIKKLKIDVFTFLSSFPFDDYLNYSFEMDNLAAISINTHEYWFNNQIPKNTKKAILRSLKRGVEIKEVAFSDKLVHQIKEIFDETPFRQGKRFWHYKKDFEIIKKEMGQDLNFSRFIGAFYQNELIGFAKLYRGKKWLRMVQILSKISHRNKCVTNSLISEAVKICENENIPYLIYGKYNYGKKGDDTLTQFKKNNGFIKYDLPRYYVPVSKKGSLALKTGFYRWSYFLLPQCFFKILLKVRKKFGSTFQSVVSG